MMKKLVVISWFHHGVLSMLVLVVRSQISPEDSRLNRGCSSNGRRESRPAGDNYDETTYSLALLHSHRLGALYLLTLPLSLSLSLFRLYYSLIHLPHTHSRFPKSHRRERPLHWILMSPGNK